MQDKFHGLLGTKPGADLHIELAEVTGHRVENYFFTIFYARVVCDTPN